MVMYDKIFMKSFVYGPYERGLMVEFDSGKCTRCTNKNLVFICRLIE